MTKIEKALVEGFRKKCSEFCKGKRGEEVLVYAEYVKAVREEIAKSIKGGSMGKQ